MINIGKENELIEFKKSTSELNEAIISISAMLNKNSKGKLYFGVKNNGDCVGQQISESTLRDISRKIYEGIKPTIYPSIHIMEDAPGVIEVEFAGHEKPYSAEGRFYIRVADEDKKIDINELLKMVNRTDSSNSLWERMESEEGVEDVDEELLKEYLEKANASGRINEKYTNKKEILGKLGLLNNERLNNAGRILFSKNKPIALKLAVFPSDEKLSFIDISRFEGNLFELAKKGQDYIKEHINYGASIKDGKRIESPEIPLEAIREVVMNSLCHSSFDSSINHEIYITPSRVSVFNPGTFPSSYEPDDFAYNGVESVLRNPLIAKALYYSNDIDSWATGFRRIFSLCKKENVKFAYLKKNQGFQFIFYRKNMEGKDKDKNIIIDSINNNPKISTTELADIIGKSRRTVQELMNQLRDEGRVQRIGANKNGIWIAKIA